MEWIELDQGDVDEHGSSGLYLIEAARFDADAHFRTHIARVSPGGILGRHAGRWWQLFCVATGDGWVSAGTQQRLRELLAESSSAGAPQGVHLVVRLGHAKPPTVVSGRASEDSALPEALCASQE